MDAKAIVREMLANGHSKEDILANLQELGIPNAEKYYEEALAGEGRGVLAPGFGKKGDDAEREAKDILESHTKPLFQEKGNSIFSPEPSTDEKRRADKAVEDIPELEVTSISSEGEKVEDIGEMLGKKPAGGQLMKSMPSSSFQNLDEVERKLDEMISMLKAVYEIDQKILEANRDLMLKIKMGKD